MDLKIPAINPAQLGNQLTKVGSAGTAPVAGGFDFTGRILFLHGYRRWE